MKQTGRYIIILILVLALWNTVFIKPLKIFTVFLHELGHSLMAVIFGGGIQGFRINLDESGYTLTFSKNAFSSFMIANGGYLGSILFAVLILYLKRTALKRFILGAAAILLLGVSIAYGRSVFTIVYAAIFAGVILLLYMLRYEKLNDWVIDILGVASLAYAVYDTFVDTVLLQINLRLNWIHGWKTVQAATDAVQLQQMTHVPAMLWGFIWLALAFAAAYPVMAAGGGRYAGSRGKKKAM